MVDQRLSKAVKVTQEQWDQLRQAAFAASKNAYAPYSGYRVGAAGMDANGKIYSGCNVENAGYGVTLCAECGLISDLVKEAGKKLVAFTCCNGENKRITPCGRCRQLLWEHGGKDLLVDMPRGIIPMSQVLPDGFGPEELAKESLVADANFAPAKAAEDAADSAATKTDLFTQSASISSKYNAPDIIAKKRDGLELTGEEISWTISAYTAGVMADEQMSALAMAIYLRGMNKQEILSWTKAMIASGSHLEFSALNKYLVDKHSTGGVGDKITLPLTPLVAACGLAVPQLSGRGLGHTGGTLDKLESITGWRAGISETEIFEQLKSNVGSVICAPTPNLVPADKKLYALRDVTSTVSCVPLIASSIMSKKIAEGTNALLLDVKVGSGAFMKTAEEARILARTMVELGKDAGVKTVALLTDMSAPLGLTVGNALEVRESIEVLQGGGPSDIRQLTLAFARQMLELGGKTDVDPAEVLDSGAAFAAWKRLISAQGGDPETILPVAKNSEVFTASTSGTITHMDAYLVGKAAWLLGAGRSRKEDPVQAGAGIEILAPLGSKVIAGEPVFRLHTDTPDKFAIAMQSLAEAVTIEGNGHALQRELIIEKIS